MELPIKKAVLDKDTKGLKAVSLVADPAIQIEWITFENQEQIKLSIQNEEKRIIFTPVLIPNQKIYRNINGEEFNLMFDEQTINDTAYQWMRDNLSGAVDINHSQKLIEGVTFFESFLLSDRASQVNEKYSKLPLGTWFLTGKVEDDGVWQKIKSGELTGVSIDGLFKTQQVTMSITDEELKKIITHL